MAAPAKWDEVSWHLREIAYRSLPILPEDERPAVGTTVLRPSSAGNFKPSVAWLREALTEKTMTPDLEIRAIGSPHYETLTSEIEKIAPGIRAGKLTGVELIIVVDATHAAQVQTALSRSGAKLRIVDPFTQYPQPRSERAATARMTCLSAWCRLPSAQMPSPTQTI